MGHHPVVRTHGLAVDVPAAVDTSIVRASIQRPLSCLPGLGGLGDRRRVGHEDPPAWSTGSAWGTTRHGSGRSSTTRERAIGLVDAVVAVRRRRERVKRGGPRN